MNSCKIRYSETIFRGGIFLKYDNRCKSKQILRYGNGIMIKNGIIETSV